MFSKIMVPVDLQHTDRVERAIKAAADLAKQSDGELILAGVTTPEPSAAAHNPAEYAEKLSVYAKEQSASHGVTFKPEALMGHDVAVDLDKVLMKAIEDDGVDCVVMASHKPGMMEHIFASNAGYLANHAPVSVFVVR